MRNSGLKQKQSWLQLRRNCIRRCALAMLIACGTLACGCLLPAKPRSVTVLGDGRKNWWDAGEAVNVPASANTNGLWVLTPEMLESMALESVR